MGADEAERIEEAWLEASGRLHIEVEAGYVLDRDLGSTTFLLYLPDFGGPNGVVVMEMGHGEGNLPALLARDAELVYAELPGTFTRFESERFQEALNEWGWYGPPEDAPPWFAGHVWRA